MKEKSEIFTHLVLEKLVNHFEKKYKVCKPVISSSALPKKYDKKLQKSI